MLQISADRLRGFVASAYRMVGISESDANRIAELQTEADLRGADGHGVFRLPQYIRRIKTGGVNVAPKIRIERETAAMALVDGDNGMGHLVMRFAAQTALAKARQSGVAWVGARMSNHAGPASLYATMPLAEGMIGLYFAVGNANHLAPWGGIELLLSTNPIAVAIPAREELPIVHSAGRLGGTIPVWDIRKKFGDTNLLVVSKEHGRDLVACLGDNTVALMRGHGCVVTGPTVETTVLTSIYLRVNARLQIDAMRMGEVIYLSPGEIELSSQRNKPKVGDDRAWEYLCARAKIEPEAL